MGKFIFLLYPNEEKVIMNKLFARAALYYCYIFHNIPVNHGDAETGKKKFYHFNKYSLLRQKQEEKENTLHYKCSITENIMDASNILIFTRIRDGGRTQQWMKAKLKTGKRNDIS